ncbi:MAG: UbiH/UbiF/VisC/COQ6 family ubiquinone biosynthesis hydroxylase, partial [Pontibacterium sp.]
MKTDFDVVVVGGGMVGLALACHLADAGIKTAVLEQREGDPKSFINMVDKAEQYDPRVSALTSASQSFLAAIGAWDGIRRRRACGYTDMDVWDGIGQGQVHFASRELHLATLGHIVENRVTLAALFEAMMQREACLTFLSGARVKAMTTPSESDTATGKAYSRLSLDDGREITAQLIVAADGAESNTRRMAGIPLWDWDYGHHAIVTTVKTQQPHQFTAWQRFTEDGPLAFLPLAGGNDQLSSIVWSTSPDHADALMALTDDEFCAALSKGFEQRLGAVEWTDKRYSVPLRQRHAKCYVKEGLALVGDAAHTIHPLAGQGVNLGFMDAQVLAELLSDAHVLGKPLGSLGLLRRFQRRRQAENIKMAAAMEGFKQLFGTQNPLVTLARSKGMALFNQSGPVKQHLIMAA